MKNLAEFIRDVPDFPKKGIIFKDITPLLSCPAALDETVGRLAEPYENSNVNVVAAVESRGFIFGAAVACRLGAGFVPIRKPGKLPYETVKKEYALEYGTDAVEIHADAVTSGTRVLMIDDLLATGGTMAAACDLVTGLGGDIVAAAFVIELCFLDGRAKIPVDNILSLLRVQ